MNKKFWLIISSSIVLTACHSVPTANQAQTKTQQIYHAPAQIYDFDLGSTVLRGKLKLKQSCNVYGTSLDIQDQLGQQVRVDSFNLNNNASLNSTTQSSLEQIAPLITARYQQRFKATQVTHHKTTAINAVDIAFYQLDVAQHPLQLAVLVRDGFAYAVLLNSPITQNDAQKSQQQLQILLNSLFIPGSKINATTSDLPIAFDLSQQNTQTRQNWQKTYCS